MAQAHEYAQLAGRVRRLYESLASVTEALVEHRHGQLSAESLDVELKLMQLHGQLVELALKPSRASRREDRTHGGDERIPF